MEDTAKTKELALAMAKLLDDHKALDTCVLDLEGVCGWTDYFVIATASSQGHRDGLWRHLMDSLNDAGAVFRSRHRKVADDDWLLLDCGDFVVHLMSREMREFYDLENLWYAAKKIYGQSA